jgi:hypothetical protein
MKLICYSDLFKLDNERIEFCLGMIIEDDRLILSYSTFDTNRFIGTYDINYINNKLVWNKVI